MDRVEVVCVTMGQKDLTIADKMHITGDAVFGNQAGGYRKETQSDAGRTLRMITTDTRGVGVNRNIALLHATGDILLFADDDICYADGYADGVRRAYAQHPDADMILFSLDITQGGRVIRRIKSRDGRLRFHRTLRYGTCVCSIRRDSQRRANIWFSTLFGGGTNYAHGEDTLFLCDAFRRGLRVYTSSFCLGTCAKDASTCFHGFDEKYFHDQGVLYRAAFGAAATPLCLRFCLKRYSAYRGEMTFFRALRAMYRGTRETPRDKRPQRGTGAQ